MKFKMSIGAKIIIMAIVIAVIAAVIGVIGLSTTQQAGNLVKSLYNQNLQGVKYAKEIKYQVQALAVALLNGNMQTKAEGVKKYQDSFNAAYDLYKKAVENYETTIDNEKERALIKTISDAGGEYYAASQEMFEFFSKGQMAEATVYGNSVLVPVRNQKLNPAVEELVAYNEKAGEEDYVASTVITRNAVITIVAAIIIGLALSLVLAITITRGITKPVSGIVTNLSEASSQIAVSSTQLSDSSQSIANGASEQAAGIEETTASIEELTSMVKQNLENAKQASLLSEKATEASQDGSSQMELMSNAMAAISKSTEEIKTVIDVIDDIAFQTNMLALNAAVEAARAGEAGMGFAVVADEVKNLANRSSESAKETSSMIKATLKNVEEGMGISKQLSEIFKEILANSRKVLEMTKEVESASVQQDVGISQVNKAIIQFDSVVQTNASSAEETASAAEEMQGQVVTLKDVVTDLYSLVTGKDYTEGIVRHDAGRAPAKRIAPTAAAAPQKSRQIEHKAVAAKSPASKEGEHVISFESDEEYKVEE